jgi:hypothetical protein
MSDEILTAIKNKDYAQLLKTALLEESNNRLTTICRRSLNKRGSDTYGKVGPIYAIIEELEKLADEYKHFSKNLARAVQSGSTLRPEVITFFERTNEVLRLYYELFYKFDVKKISAIEDARKKFMGDAHKAIESKKITPAEIYVLHHSMIIMDIIFSMTGPYLVLSH